MVEIARDSPGKVVQGKKRGRKPKLPLMKEVELAYGISITWTGSRNAA